MLSFTLKYIARYNDSLMNIPIKDLSACKRLSLQQKLYSELYASTIDIWNEEYNVVNEAYNVHKVIKNTWLLTASEPIEATINCAKTDTKTIVIKTNSIFRLLYRLCKPNSKS